MRASLFAFWVSHKHDYDELTNAIEELVDEIKPNFTQDETEGFINFEQLDRYVYLEFYFSFLQEKADPAGIGTYFVPTKGVIPIALIKDPYMLILFTRSAFQRDKILELLPIKPEYREGFSISSDFIEFLNVPKPEKWMEKVLGDSIEPRGRRGRSSKTHTITEKYSSPEEREVDLEKEGKNYVFRDFAEVNVSLEEVSITCILYPTGKITINTLGQERKLLAPYIAKVLKVIKDAESRYLELKGIIQGENDG